MSYGAFRAYLVMSAAGLGLAFVAALPVGVEDPVERLSAVRSQMEVLKRSGQAVAGATLTSLSGFAPPMLFALGARAGARAPQSPINTVTYKRPRTPAPDVFRRAEDAERVPIRPARRPGAYRRRDLLV